MEISQLFRDAHHVDHMLPILKRLTDAFATLQRAFGNRLRPIASVLSKGLASLPDDLLALIFEFASPPGEGTRQAVWLSHVSRWFRRVALNACRLWTTLHTDSTRKELKTLIARSGKTTDLHIVVHKSDDDVDINDFLDICTPMVSRWSTFTISCELDNWDGDELETVDGTMRDVFRRYQLALPRLRELRVRQHRSDVDTGFDTWATEKFFPSWTTPNLRVIHCNEYIPLPYPAYSAVTLFTTSFSLATDQ